MVQSHSEEANANRRTRTPWRAASLTSVPMNRNPSVGVRRLAKNSGAWCTFSQALA